jgi:rhodanese-related sulfurtransferase
LELLELLAQRERSVDSLATETGLSLANASQHLQALRRASLVETRRDGLFVYYRLAEPAVFDLCVALRTAAERRLSDLERLVDEYFGDRSNPEPVGMRELLDRIQSNDVIVLDARPATEFEAGHIAGAISVPIDTLQQRLRSLPRDREYVAYCRGPYCVYADRAVDQLRATRRRARRLLEGFPEWRAAGHPIARGLIETAPAGRPRALHGRQRRGSLQRPGS